MKRVVVVLVALVAVLAGYDAGVDAPVAAGQPVLSPASTTSPTRHRPI